MRPKKAQKYEPATAAGDGARVLLGLEVHTPVQRGWVTSLCPVLRQGEGTESNDVRRPNPPLSGEGQLIAPRIH